MSAVLRWRQATVRATDELVAATCGAEQQQAAAVRGLCAALGEAVQRLAWRHPPLESRQGQTPCSLGPHASTPEAEASAGEPHASCSGSRSVHFGASPGAASLLAGLAFRPRSQQLSRSGVAFAPLSQPPPVGPSRWPLSLACADTTRGVSTSGQLQLSARQKPGQQDAVTRAQLMARYLRNGHIKAPQLRVVLPDGFTLDGEPEVSAAGGGGAAAPPPSTPDSGGGGGASERSRTMAREDALRLARKVQLDLVLMAAGAEPPVARLMDFEAFVARQLEQAAQGAQRSAAAERRGTQRKELHMGTRISDHDLQVKLKRAKGFLADGLMVAFYVEYRKDEEAGEARDALEYVLLTLQSEAGASVAEQPVARTLAKGMRAWSATLRPSKRQQQPAEAQKQPSA